MVTMADISLVIFLVLCVTMIADCQEKVRGKISTQHSGDTVQLMNKTKHCGYESDRGISPSIKASCNTFNATSTESLGYQQDMQNSANHSLIFSDAHSKDMWHCIVFDPNIKNMNVNTAKVAFCILFSAEGKESINHRIRKSGADLNDPSLSRAFIIDPGEACNKSSNTTVQPYLCGFRYATHDPASDAIPLERQVCLLQDVLNDTHHDQSELRRVAAKYCSIDLTAGYWQFSQVSSVNECRLPELFLTNERITASDHTMSKIVWGVSGTSIVIDIFCAVVFSTGVRRMNKVAIFYRWVAISDALSLFGGIIPSVVVHVNHMDTLDAASTTFCILGILINRFGSTLSSVVHLHMTVNRCISVMFPLKTKVWVSAEKTKKGLIFSLVISVLGTTASEVPAFTMPRPVGYCKRLFGPGSLHGRWDLVLHWLYYVLFTLCPLAAIVGMNVGIIRALVIQARKRKEMMTNTGSNKNLHITINLLLTVSFYMLVQFPSYITQTLAKMNPSSLIAAYHSINRPLTIIRMCSGIALSILWFCMNGDFRNAVLCIPCMSIQKE